ncbi:MAG: excinuclease ABC subunit UvrC [Rhodocyclaceae bacterium]|nr:excinuclease ABC subunit UvrC [Rhodocyclaceae bacterium]
MFDAKSLIQSLPEEPGVYRMLDAEGRVLYVGKAKRLKQRVSSYFQKTLASPRTRIMVSQIAAVETTVTRTEAEALILENTLIKSLNPKYNIVFRDDKSYPYIKLSGDEYPRLSFHRGGFEKNARYFGPFPSSQAVRESLQLLQKVFLLRTCENTVFQNRSRPCLLYQIKRCSGPCVGHIGAQDYGSDARLVELFLDGRHSEIVAKLTAKMTEASDRLDFERATVFRDQIRSLQKVIQRQFVWSEGEEDADILATAAGHGTVCVTLAMVRGGRHLGDRSFFPKNAQDCSADEALLAFLGQHYAEHPAPRRAIFRLEQDSELQGAIEALGTGKASFGAPKNEMERAWLAMAEKNASLALAAQAFDASRSRQRLEALQDLLQLPEPPGRIECFDISHTMGEATVASCVVFSEGRMNKAEYRHFNLSGIAPGDDYGAMRQALARRYGKLATGEGVAPDLLLIDGGKGQLGVAREVMAELGLDAIPLVGVAKGEERKPGLEELVFCDGRESLCPGGASPALHLIQEVRDEAHRFAITGHRARRAKARQTSRLEDIAGVGPAKRKRLLEQFGGLAGVQAATVEDLIRVDGISRKLAEEIYRGLH